MVSGSQGSPTKPGSSEVSREHGVEGGGWGGEDRVLVGLKPPQFGARLAPRGPVPGLRHTVSGRHPHTQHGGLPPGLPSSCCHLHLPSLLPIRAVPPGAPGWSAETPHTPAAFKSRVVQGARGSGADEGCSFLICPAAGVCSGPAVGRGQRGALSEGHPPTQAQGLRSGHPASSGDHDRCTAHSQPQERPPCPGDRAGLQLGQEAPGRTGAGTCPREGAATRKEESGGEWEGGRAGRELGRWSLGARGPPGLRDASVSC